MDETNTPKITTRTIEISLWKAFGILATSIISATGVAIFSTVRILQSDHYALIGLSHRIGILEANNTAPDVLRIQFENTTKRLDSIEAKVDRLIESR